MKTKLKRVLPELPFEIWEVLVDGQAVGTVASSPFGWVGYLFGYFVLHNEMSGNFTNKEEAAQAVAKKYAEEMSMVKK